jgi:hypothetical protein
MWSGQALACGEGLSWTWLSLLHVCAVAALAMAWWSSYEAEVWRSPVDSVCVLPSSKTSFTARTWIHVCHPGAVRETCGSQGISLTAHKIII